MNKFAQKLVYSAWYRLNTVKNRIERDEEDRKSREWDNKFNAEGFFDHILQPKLKIRLYRDSVLSKLISNGFENAELEFLERFLKNGDTFFDIGSNIGLFSLIASTKIGSEGRIFAFEPSPQTFKRLSENIELNGINNIKLHNIGLSDEVGKLKLYISENGFDAWNSFAGQGDVKFQKAVEVEVNTLDNIVESNNIKDIALIKIDVEGWEKFVFQGGETFLKKTSPVLMVEFTEENTFSAGYFVHELYDILESWGYKWYRYQNGEMVEEPKKMHYPYDNLFAVKDINVINNRFAK